MKIMPLLLVGAFALTSGNLWAASGRQDSIERLQMSSEVLHSIMNAPDKGIPDEVVKDAKCIVVVPHLVKGGFVVGGEHGRGIASCRTAEGWSAPGVRLYRRRKLGAADWRRRRRPGHGRHERPRPAASARRQIPAERRCIGLRRPGGPPCFGGNRLEDDYGSADLLALARGLCGNHPGWSCGGAGCGFHSRHLWPQCIFPVDTFGPRTRTAIYAELYAGCRRDGPRGHAC